MTFRLFCNRIFNQMPFYFKCLYNLFSFLPLFLCYASVWSTVSLAPHTIFGRRLNMFRIVLLFSVSGIGHIRSIKLESLIHFVCSVSQSSSLVFGFHTCFMLLADGIHGGARQLSPSLSLAFHSSPFCSLSLSLS